MPNSVKTIGNYAFEYSALKSITLGSGVESIGSKAFMKCLSLTDITTLAEVPPTLTDDAFSNTNKGNITLTVPFGTADAYKAARNWNGFKAYVEAEKGPGVGVEGIEAAAPSPELPST